MKKTRSRQTPSSQHYNNNRGRGRNRNQQSNNSGFDNYQDDYDDQSWDSNESSGNNFRNQGRMNMSGSDRESYRGERFNDPGMNRYNQQWNDRPFSGFGPSYSNPQ